MKSQRSEDILFSLRGDRRGPFDAELCVDVCSSSQSYPDYVGVYSVQADNH